MLGNSVVVVVVRTRPRAIPLAMITMRKSTHGFPLLSCDKYGAPLGGPSGHRSSAINVKEAWAAKGIVRHLDVSSVVGLLIENGKLVSQIAREVAVVVKFNTPLFRDWYNHLSNYTKTIIRLRFMNIGEYLLNIYFIIVKAQSNSHDSWWKFQISFYHALCKRERNYYELSCRIWICPNYMIVGEIWW